MNYIGSKQYLQDFIHSGLTSFCGNVNDKIICDLFSGMGSAFSSVTCKELIVNDVEYYSFIVLKSKFSTYKDYKDILENLNDEKLLKKGKISTYFSSLGEEGRNYFTPLNAQRIDAIREILQKYKSKDIFYPLLSSLLKASDEVANTACQYGAYLKHTKQSAKKPLFLKPIKKAKMNARVFNENGSDLLQKINGDILYLDPPYNHRQYGLNYHVLNAIAKYEDFSPRGISGYDEYFRSNWCKAREVKEELVKTIKNANFDFIALSYSEDGLLKPSEIESLMKKYGVYKCLHVKHDALRMQKKSKKHTIEYLHLLEKK